MSLKYPKLPGFFVVFYDFFKHQKSIFGAWIDLCLQAFYYKQVASLIGLVAIFFASTVCAQTVVGNEISSNTQWSLAGSPYILGGDVVVSGGAVLTIDAGVVVYMGNSSSLTVSSGAIKAIGSPQNPIQVLSDKIRLGQSGAPGDWKHWNFASNSSASRLDYVRFEHGSGLTVYGAAPVFNYLNILNHQGPAITVDFAAAPSGEGNQASGNVINGILLPSGVVSGSTRLSLKGIPYFIESGVLSVGTPPEITTINTFPLEQGRMATYEITGRRLAGLASITLDRPGMTPRVTTASADGVRFEVSAPMDAALGPVKMTLLLDAGEAVMSNAFSIVARRPRITGMTPSRLMVGQGNVLIALQGDTFTTQSSVLLNSQPISSQWIDATNMLATLPNQLAAGNVPIRIRNGTDILGDELQLIVDPQPLAFSPPNLNVLKGDSAQLTVQLAQTAPADIAIKLTSSPANSLSIPSSITIPAGSREASVAVKGVVGGVATVTASQDGYVATTAQVAVEVPMAVRIDPSPLVLAPNSQNRSFALGLSHADTVAHQFALSIDKPEIAALLSTTIEIPAGQVSVPVTIKGLAEGYAQLRISSPTLGDSVSAIYVSQDYQAMSMARSDTLGVYMPGGPYVGRTDITGITLSNAVGVFVDKPGARISDSRFMLVSPPLGLRFGSANDGKSQYGELFAPSLSLAVGPVISGADQTVLPRGQTFNLVIKGANLATVNQISIAPADGIQLGTPQVAGDGLSFTVPMTVQASAVSGPRKLSVFSPAGRVQESKPEALRLSVDSN